MCPIFLNIEAAAQNKAEMHPAHMQFASPVRRAILIGSDISSTTSFFSSSGEVRWLSWLVSRGAHPQHVYLNPLIFPLLRHQLLSLQDSSKRCQSKRGIKYYEALSCLISKPFPPVQHSVIKLKFWHPGLSLNYLSYLVHGSQFSWWKGLFPKTHHWDREERKDSF